MKKLFIKDFLAMDCSSKPEVLVLGWLKNKRVHKNVIFLDMVDSTGSIQCILDKRLVNGFLFENASDLKIESSLSVSGNLVPKKNDTSGVEVLVTNFTVIGGVSLNISPYARDDFDIFNENLIDNTLHYRHLYIRNPRIMAVLKFRNLLKEIMREWFSQNEFAELDAPILVPAPLYEGRTAIDLNIHGEDVFLSQCAGYYLESAAHAFEKVYNMGPSFRGEESRSRRHLIEYWHIKAELAWGDREDIIKIVEDIFVFIAQQISKRSGDLPSIIGKDLCLDGLKVPFPRLNYRDAVKMLQEKGVDIKFGISLGSEEEAILSESFDSPFWVVGIPRSIEPFPYRIDPNDPQVTMVADLIANNGYGELLGVAEKIYDMDMLNVRMAEKNKDSDPIYDFIKQVHQVGCVPHIAFGMGLERLMRWLLNIPHVRDCIPFPRVVGRHIMP